MSSEAPPIATSDDEVDQVVDTKPVKKSKKVRTPAQQESFKKALQVLKERREGKKKEEEEKLAKATEQEKEQIQKEKYEKAKNHRKKLPPAPSYVTTGDLEKFKQDLLSAMVKPEPVKPEPVKQVEPKPIVPPTPKKQVVVQKPLTGHDLLDKLFFS